MFECEIPKEEHDKILDVFWTLLKTIEGSTSPERNILDARLVAEAYTVLNRIGYTKYRPRWEKS